jgi:hypothetical protein
MGGYNRVCKRFGRGSLGAILWLIGVEVASPAVEEKDKGEERSVLLFGWLCSRCRAWSFPKDSISVLFWPPPL